MTNKRTEIEIAFESSVMQYLSILKYAKHHTPLGEDPYKVADHVFTCLMNQSSQNQTKEEENDD